MRFLLLPLLVATLAAQQPWQFAAHSVAPGTRLDLDLPVPSLGDPATVIPVSVFHGSQSGPVFVLTCGVHGFEFVPILAAQQLLQQLDPKQLRGTVVLVRLAHLPAFEHRSIFFNPFDGKNLNRVFPGSPLGSQSQRIAHLLSTLVIDRADFHIDMHGGDGTESLYSFAGIYSGALASSQAAKSREIGIAFGLPTVVEYKVDTEEQLNNGRSCNRQAVAAGKPTVLIEIGESGRRDQSLVDAAVRGIFNVLKSQQMLPGLPLRTKRMPLIHAGTVSVSATHAGIWYPRVAPGAAVRKGDTIGVIRDYAGKDLEAILAPEEGLLLYMSSAPPINAGQSVVTIARPPRAKDASR